MTHYVFVGERRSALAKRKGWYWSDGHLAAKQLFDDLRPIGIQPEGQWFTNIIEPDCVATCKHALSNGSTVVSLGKKAHLFLVSKNIPHKTLVHPAARGSIRKKQIYCEHVRLELVCGSCGDRVASL